MVRIIAALALFIAAVGGTALVLTDRLGLRTGGNDDAVRALTAQPTSGDPLARAATTERDRARIAQLVDAAIRRDPRSVTPWFLRLRMAAEANDGRGVAVAALRLLAINPSRGDRYLPVLAAITPDPAAQPLILAALQRKPAWARLYSQAIVKQGTAPATVFRTIQAQVSALDPGAGTAQANFLDAMVRQGEFDQAYLAWINFLPEEALDKVGPIYDPEFRGLPGPPPFNWQLSDGTSQAKLRTGGGLTVNYSSERENRLAGQIVMLPAGTYRLTTAVEMADAPGAGGVEWQLMCLPGTRPLVRVPLDNGGTVASPPFEIPADCKAQRLALTGQSQQFPVTRDLTIRSIAIERAGGGA
jgi:hypothetical protein